MTDKIILLGDLSEVLNYNLNNQNLTLKKLIITPNYINEGFKNISLEQISERHRDELSSLEINFNDSFYHTIQECLKKISSVYVDTKIDKMSLVNSLSNSKFNVILRTESYSITKYFVDSPSVLGNIRKLIKEYYSLVINQTLKSYESFQVEIVESEEVDKSIILKKENSKFILASSYGVYQSESGIDNLIDPEIYVCENTLFSHYESAQSYALFREANKIVKKQIQGNGKVLNQDELKEISLKTKDLDNVYVKLYINNKGAIRISNLSLLENDVYEFTKYGFFVNRNSVDVDKISLVGIDDGLDIEYPYYKFLLIKDLNEFNFFVQNLDKFVVDLKFNFDGLVLNFNVQNKFLDYLGVFFDVNVIVYSESLDEVKSARLIKPLILEQINSSSDVFGALSGQANSDANFQRLKSLGKEVEQNVLGSSFEQSLSGDTAFVTNSDEYKNNLNNDQTQYSINYSNSENSLSNNNNNNNYNNSNNELNNQGENMADNSAIDFFMNRVADVDSKKQQREQDVGQQQQSFSGSQSTQQSVSGYDNVVNNNNNNNFQQSDSLNESFLGQVNSSVDSHSVGNSEEQANLINQKLNVAQQQFDEQTNMSSSFSQSIDLDKRSVLDSRIDLNKFDNCLAIDLITLSNLGGDKYFLNEKSFNLDKRAFVLINNKEEFVESEKLDFILPFTNSEDENFFYLINSSENFFYLEGVAKGFFVNLSQLNQEIRENFVRSLHSKSDNIYLILNKSELDVVENIVDLVKGVYVTDLHNVEDFEFCKSVLLKFEKKVLISLLNEKV